MISLQNEYHLSLLNFPMDFFPSILKEYFPMGIFENPTGIFFSAGELKIPVGMPTLADIFPSTVKYFVMKSYRNYSECSIVMC